jgi:hypothetical protein
MSIFEIELKPRKKSPILRKFYPYYLILIFLIEKKYSISCEKDAKHSAKNINFQEIQRKLLPYC